MRAPVKAVLAYLAGAATVIAGLVVREAMQDPPTPPGAHVAAAIDLLTATEPASRTVDVYAGLGSWVDAFDFDPAYQNGGTPPIGVGDIDAMAASGVRTLFVQAARLDRRSPKGLTDPVALGALLVRAHQHGMRVVGWYLPRFADVDADLARLDAIRTLDVFGHRFDGVALDIEFADDVPDAALRSRRLVDVVKRFAARSGDDALGAIVLPPVQLEVINSQLWPDFPWRALASRVDVWLPMGYWTYRSADSGYHDGFTYVEESVRRLRRDVGDPEVRVHPIGGIGDLVTAGELRRFSDAVDRTAAIGASIYDWQTLDREKRDLLKDLFAG
jgi:hypothetical protein